MGVADLLYRAQPAWARSDHPLVRRELRALPPCLGRDRSWRFWLALVLLAGVSGYGLNYVLSLQLVWEAIGLGVSWLPLLWATRIFAREAAAGTWDVLRLTPYSLGEITHAKLAAVGRITAPLLVFLLVGAIAASQPAGFLGGWSRTGGQVPPYAGQGALDRLGPNLLLTTMLLGIRLLAIGIDYALTIAIGGLVSSAGRGGRLPRAVALRLLISSLLLIVHYTPGLIATGQLPNPVPLIQGSLAALVRPEWVSASGRAWVVLATPTASYAGQVIVDLISLGAALIALAIVVRLTVIRLRGRS